MIQFVAILLCNLGWNSYREKKVKNLVVHLFWLALYLSLKWYLFGQMFLCGF